MRRKKLSVFPFVRIPNFKGAQAAAKKLLELPEFVSAKSVEVNPDKPLEFVRILVLENDKQLFVPVPQLRNSLLKELEKSKEHDIRKVVSRWGIDNIGKEVGLDDKIHIDLLVLGSVAVSKEGYRIGKGQGFADLEFALLKEMKSIDDKTTIVTVVHDIQVFDELPKELFHNYDVPVDYIVTATEIIKTNLNLPKPEGVYWNMITKKRLSQIEVLQKLKEKHEAEGKEVVLKRPENNSGSPSKRHYRYRRFNHRSRPRKSETFNNVPCDSIKNESSFQNESEREINENIENIPPQMKKKKKSGRRPNNGYSLCVSNIHKSVRVRDLKNALIEKGIKPSAITWQPFRGLCYLHYSKKHVKNELKNEQDEEKRDPFLIDNVIELIQEMKVNPNSTQNLNVKVMEPITRIETLDVTAV